MDFVPTETSRILLVDNGSLQPASTTSLRRIAAELARRLGSAVEPVSLLHSSGVDPAELDGRRAEIFEPALRRHYAGGVRKIVVLPLFFGPSAAITEYIPERVAVMARDLPGLRVRMADTLVASPSGNADERVARILSAHVRDVMKRRELERPIVVLVDHGSPQPAVTAIRDHMATTLARLLSEDVASVVPASMERRAGAGYDFAEPLLARALRAPPCGGGAGDVVVAMLFVSPGRHAGPGGDVELICRAAEAECPGMRVHITPLVGEHPLLIEILADRYRAVLG